MSAPTTAICLYRVSAGREDAFADLLKRHWPTLSALGLVTDRRPLHYRGVEREGGTLFVEIFEWRSEDASGVAHQHPEVMAIWEPMDALTESRGGRPNMEFPHVQPIQIL
jgi:hypothetical protein